MEKEWGNKGNEAMHSSPPTSAAAPMGFEYHVLLSCYSFYERVWLEKELEDAGLSVFVGERNPTSSRMEAIEQFKLCIPVFSPFYPSSIIDLDDVAKLNECRRRTSGQIVLPIFYRIKPSDVGSRTRLFEGRFSEEGVDPHVIKKWKKAIREIGSLQGYILSDAYTPDGVEKINYQFKEIVHQVVKLLVDDVPLDNNLVAIERSYRSVVEMLYNTSKKREVQVVGICGMPGIGKTTLARALYTNLRGFYEGCSFVSSIQERSKKKDGLPSLQLQLIKDLLDTNNIHFGSFDDNLQFIRNRFSKTRVLIVLDSVEHLDHIRAFGVDLQCFGRQSRIILTTRKPDLLVEANVPHRYFLEELDEHHALKLFCKHMFQNDSPEEEYCHLSAEIASSTRGIPRVIESVVSDLSKHENKEMEKWEGVLQQLKSGKYEPLEELLMLSPEYLSKGRWHFYHDIKCFPMGRSNDIAHYDVILSFDARDKVKNLVESLHKRLESFGIGIFVLNGDFVEINQTGKVLIPVISKSYVLNPSCLEMLVRMVECKRSSATNHILPIFYVKIPTPLYPSEDDEVVNRWKEALTEVANISGSSPLGTCMMEENVNQTDSICQMVLHKLKLNQLSMGNHLVGIDHRLERILELLNLEVNDVRIIAISGEDGAGKTTLAKIVYHQLSSSFEGCSFLVEIDETTRRDDGLKYLQAKMISDLLNRKDEVFQSIIEEVDVMERRFQHMKVLIILDDVTNSSHVEALVGQLNWFGSGSRIIIATQDPTIIPLPHLNYKIMTNRRSAFDNAYKLFSKHTFRKDEPPPNFESLSRQIVYSLTAYPLVAIEIVGSLLYGTDVAVWKSLSKKLMRERSLEHILGICYDRLNSTQQQVFLDISCLPSGMDRRIVSYLWYDSQHSSGLDDMQALIHLMLVKVDASNGIWMHRLVRDFCREIVHGKSQKVSRKGEGFSREIAREKSQKLIRKVLDFGGEILRLTGQKENRSGEDCAIMRQRDLIWQQCPTDLPPTLHSKLLKVLDMSWSKITEDWEGWKKLKVPQLRVLNLSGCSNLMVTPVFSFCPDLEMLILEHCPRLVKIDPSICQLQHLNTLKLSCCCELSVLPKELGRLTALTELLLDGTSLRELPVSISRLKNLQLFTVINCFSLSYLPGATLNLLSLTVVKLDYANITELPRAFGQKMKLQHLSLRGCAGITRLPSLVGEVERSLVELDVSKTSISELPKWITKLKALRVLKMEYCFITEFPPHFGALRRLEEIHASRCRNLVNLPDDVGKLESLRILDIGESCVSSLPQSIRALARLETLDCTSCNMLQNLPELPSSLTSVHVESKDLPDLVNLKQLKEFTLGSDKIVNLRALLNVPKIEKDGSDWLPESSLGSDKIVNLGALSNVPNIEKDGSFDWLPESSLRTLRLSLPLIENLPGFPDSLRKLTLHCTKLKHIPTSSFNTGGFVYSGL